MAFRASAADRRVGRAGRSRAGLAQVALTTPDNNEVGKQVSRVCEGNERDAQALESVCSWLVETRLEDGVEEALAGGNRMIGQGGGGCLSAFDKICGKSDAEASS